MRIKEKYSQISPQDLSRVVVNIRFQECAPDDHQTTFKMSDCLAVPEDNDKDYFGGTFFGNYEIQRGKRRFFIRPGDFKQAVDSAILAYEQGLDYII